MASSSGQSPAQSRHGLSEIEISLQMLAAGMLGPVHLSIPTPISSSNLSVRFRYAGPQFSRNALHYPATRLLLPGQLSGALLSAY